MIGARVIQRCLVWTVALTKLAADAIITNKDPIMCVTVIFNLCYGYQKVNLSIIKEYSRSPTTEPLEWALLNGLNAIDMLCNIWSRQHGGRWWPGAHLQGCLLWKSGIGRVITYNDICNNDYQFQMYISRLGTLRCMLQWERASERRQGHCWWPVLTSPWKTRWEEIYSAMPNYTIIR